MGDVAPRGQKDSGANTFGLFQNWLRNPKCGSWLITLDNVDDAQVIQEPPSEGQKGQSRSRRVDYIPSCANRAILITSRYRDVTSKIVRPSAIVHVGLMDVSDAVTIMATRVKIACERDVMVDVVRALSSIPPDSSQAAA
jgi:hypothetical protein